MVLPSQSSSLCCVRCSGLTFYFSCSIFRFSSRDTMKYICIEIKVNILVIIRKGIVLHSRWRRLCVLQIVLLSFVSLWSTRIDMTTLHSPPAQQRLGNSLFFRKCWSTFSSSVLELLLSACNSCLSIIFHLDVQKGSIHEMSRASIAYTPNLLSLVPVSSFFNCNSLICSFSSCKNLPSSHSVYFSSSNCVLFLINFLSILCKQLVFFLFFFWVVTEKSERANDLGLHYNKVRTGLKST